MSAEIDSDYWSRYYEVTVDRPAWETARLAARAFDREPATEGTRFAVDLGCGAGRDARELLRLGWRVLAVDREPRAIAALRAATAPEVVDRLATRVADLATIDIPRCDLVNASLSLPFLPATAFWSAWQRALGALPVGGRVAAMLFGDRDDGASDPTMTCPPADAIAATLRDFEIEHWLDREEDSTTALGEPHHFHRIEFVARRIR